ncbi:right-handed parallel beta-helix repeat-containing protein [Labilibaculum euxinus]
MRNKSRVIAVMMILTMWFSFASCDDELVEEQDSTEVVEPIVDENNDDTTVADTTGGTNTENRPIIENQTFNKTLIIDGHKNDSLIIRNCTFENMSDIALLIKTVDHVIIRDCIFRNLQSHAIFLQAGQSSDDILIEGNEIYNVSGIGIFAGEDHINTKCLGNIINEVGLVNIDGHTPHGIYLCGKNFMIEGNTISKCGSEDGKGVGISVRSYGTISKNKIYDGKASGISFSSDHSAFYGTLLIENNVIFDNFENAISLYMSNEDSPLGKVTVRFNTLLSGNKPVIYANTWKSMESELESFGNILIRTDGDINYVDVSTSNPFIESQNLVSSGDLGFSNFTERDFHLISGSKALNFAVGILDFPQEDMEDKNRSSSDLDAGAYEAK